MADSISATRMPIAAAHGGLIYVSSQRGKGTVVTARIRADLPQAVEGEPAELEIVSRGPCQEKAA
jgi:hypothetical protein